MSGHETFEHKVKRLEGEAKSGDTDKLAEELHGMSKEERHAVAERIKLDQKKHPGAHLPKIEFYGDDELKHTVGKSHGVTKDTHYDHQTGKKDSEKIADGTVTHDTKYDPTSGKTKSDDITAKGDTADLKYTEHIEYAPNGDIKSDHKKYTNGD